MRDTLARLAALTGLVMLAGGCGGGGTRTAAPGPTTPAVTEASPAGHCQPAMLQPDRGNPHVTDLAYPYADHPAASGPHYPIWLPPSPQVYSAPVPEAEAVHNLEHGYVLVYYRPGEPATVVSRLAAAVGGERKVLLAPYPQLPPGTAVDLVAWREIASCSENTPPEELTAAVKDFVASFREGRLAPEPAAG